MEREREREREKGGEGETRDGWPENGERRRMRGKTRILKRLERKREKRNRNGLIETKSNLDGRKTNVFMDEDEFYIG